MKRIAIAASLLALSGCAPMMVGAGVTAAGLGGGVLAAAGVSPVVLSDVAMGACAAQAAANALGALATSHGDTRLAGGASVASQIAGAACTW